MIAIVTGLPGASKSYELAQKAVFLVARNKKWYKKQLKLHEKDPDNWDHPQIRVVRSNLKLSKEFEQLSGDFLEYWLEPEELPKMVNCDVLWEEMGAHVDSRSWENLPLSLRRWLQQHRHRGIEIYGNCQDFADVDVAIRRLTGQLLYLIKVVGSRDPSPTTLPPRIIWGVIARFYMDPRTYKEETKFEGMAFAGLSFIDKKGVSLYSMFNDIQPGTYPPLQHRDRLCETCGYKKVIHI